MRPYNFYADIRDQRIMSIAQTIILGAIICITLGIFISSILYFYRSNIIAQQILVLVLPIKNLQEFLFRIIWMPEVSMILFSFFILFGILVISVLIKTASLFVRTKIYINDALTISIWSAVPYLFLLPLTIVLIRLLVFLLVFIVPVLIIIAIIKIWVIMRTLRSVAVVFDLPQYKAYSVGFSVIILFVILVISIYHFNFSIFDYGNYLLYFIS